MAKKRVRRLTKAQKVAETKRLSAAADIFIRLHGDTNWARGKLSSGTAALTPEAVKYMLEELRRRDDVTAHEAEVKAQLKAEDIAAKIAVNEQVT